MLLESITLENFRQFRHESIDFAQGDNGKNVTIIIGENGTGKTTFAQAFFWCMYGETEFSDKNMLPRIGLILVTAIFPFASLSARQHRPHTGSPLSLCGDKSD